MSTQDQNQYKELIDSLITKDDINYLVEDIDKANELVFDTRLNIEDVLSKSFSHEKKEILERIAKSQGILFTDPQSVQNFLSKVRDVVETVPVIELQVAAELTEETEERIAAWIEQNIGVKTLLNVVMKPDIIGGVIISVNGKYGDYSVKKLLDVYLDQQRSQKQSNAQVPQVQQQMQQQVAAPQQMAQPQQQQPVQQVQQ